MNDRNPHRAVDRDRLLERVISLHREVDLWRGAYQHGDCEIDPACPHLVAVWRDRVEQLERLLDRQGSRLAQAERLVRLLDSRRADPADIARARRAWQAEVARHETDLADAGR